MMMDFPNRLLRFANMKRVPIEAEKFASLLKSTITFESGMN